MMVGKISWFVWWWYRSFAWWI